MPDEQKSDKVEPPKTPASKPAASPKAPKLSNGWRAAFIGLVVLVNLPLIALAFRSGPSTTVSIAPGSGFFDDFNRSELGLNYSATGGYWRIVNGELLSPGVKNNALWLRAALPDNVQVEFDARSDSSEGDVKAEIFGDGAIHASGYALTFGGRNNTVTAIGRLDDDRGMLVPPNIPSPIPNDGRVRVERRDLRVEQGRMYHWLIRRVGGELTWQIDGQTVLQLNDPEPLKGTGHDRFAFNTWDVDAFYDNLKITPL